MAKKMAKVIVPNQKDYENRIKRIIEDGAEHLHVISDFDRTLTKAFVDAEPTPSVISILRREDILGEDYTEKAYALAEKYRPIEDDPKVPLAQKKKKMSEWWQKHFDLLIKSDLNKANIAQVAATGKIQLRQGADALLAMLAERKIPLLIFSASGLGTEGINEILKENGLVYDNIFCISNSFKWDNQGFATGVNKPIIHSFNKDEGILRKFPEVADVLEDKKNVILLGDTLGDAGMAEGFDFDNLIKIGFLNEQDEDKAEEMLPKYEELYDVIITGDGDMEFLVNLFNNLEVPASGEEEKEE